MQAETGRGQRRGEGLAQQIPAAPWFTTGGEQFEFESGIVQFFAAGEESAIAEDVNAPEVIVFRIRVERITGVSEGTGSDGFLLMEDAADGSFDAG